MLGLLVGALCACSGSVGEGPPDGGGAGDGATPDSGLSAADAGDGLDAAVPDAGTADGGSPDAGAADSGAGDGGPPDAGHLDAGAGDGGCRTAPLAMDVSRINEVPDYTQTDPAYGGFVSGSNYCGPTAVSNSLMWLSNNGFPNLSAHTVDAKKDQHDLIATLGSPTYFNTSALFHGTPPAALLSGLKQYLLDRGYAPRSLQWQGWNLAAIPPEFDTGVQTPQADWLKLGVEGTGSAWLMLGLGSYDSGSDVHTITNGHWVTVVGHGFDGAQPDGRFLVIHDPWTSGATAHAYVQLVPLTSGQMVVSVSGVPNYSRSAAGYYRVDGTFSFSTPEVLLLGAVVLKLPGSCP